MTVLPRRPAALLLLVASLVLSHARAIPAQEAGCLDCHTEVTGQMHSGSHHIQGTTLSNRHCYACHWEATLDGSIDRRYHDRNGKMPVQLVIWGAGVRPTVHTPGTTAIAYQPAAIGSTSERREIAAISKHCLSCHNDANNSITPFAGDTNTPRRYAWDKQSVAARYSQTGVAPWGKYSTATSSARYKVTKAFSAHGNVVANQGGWSVASGYDGQMPVTRGGKNARSVECYDCHNAHGSSVPGVTSSYRSFNGTMNGGILKQTKVGQNGYRVNYSPTNNPDHATPNPYNSGAGLCFDCHENADAKTTPWGYTATFGASQPIMGYKDTPRFGAGAKGSAARFAGRHTRNDIASSHLKAGKFLAYSTLGTINGLCTPCHDPHGVSPTLGADMPLALPLLKGTWLTSPYREDAPPTTMPSKGSYAGKSPNMAVSWDKGELKGGTPEPQTAMTYNTDRNTFGEGVFIKESDTAFAGLCMKCHSKEALTGNRNDRIHRAVKGWGANREHAFPCSKCHQSHNSGLPRLMQTNCLESGPSGLRDSSAAPWFDEPKGDGNRAVSGTDKKIIKEAMVGCHVRRAGKSRGGPPSRPSGQSSGQSQWHIVAQW